MYPVLRLIKESLLTPSATGHPLSAHVSRHICWPWDLDPWMELNNGRTLTLYDLGRVPMSKRIGIFGALKRNGWGMTVAGSSVRYRRRIRMFQRITMHSRVIGWDHRFTYIEQSMWRQGEALNHLLVRVAATDSAGILPPHKLIAAMGYPDLQSPELPDWVQAWIAADAQRPWPPRTDN
ncbi:MAG: acyl-CoA thioesterase [Paracoccaceae bacterium]